MIGIFGDSYTVPGVGNRNNNDCQKTSWIYHLGEPVVTYGKAGSSQLNAYREFLMHHEKYDRIIFVMTNPDRSDHIGKNGDWNNPFIVGYHYTTWILQEGAWKNKIHPLVSRADNWDLEKVRAWRNWILFNVQSKQGKVFETYSKLLMQAILCKRPDAIMIPMGCWNLDVSSMPSGSHLYEYTLLQLKSLFPNQLHFHGYDNNQIYDNVNEIGCANHLTPEINQLLAGHVRLALSGQGWQDWGIMKMDPIQHQHPWDYYYDPIEL